MGNMANRKQRIDPFIKRISQTKLQSIEPVIYIKTADVTLLKNIQIANSEAKLRKETQETI